MFGSKRQKHSRPYRVKKTGIKDENIDRQILVIHRAICDKLIADHQNGGELIETLKENISQRLEEGRMRYGEYITWYSALEIIDQPEQFKAGILEDSQRMRKFRRKTPLVGILTEQERQEALNRDALGTTTIDTLY